MKRDPLYVPFVTTEVAKLDQRALAHARALAKTMDEATARGIREATGPFAKILPLRKAPPTECKFCKCAVNENDFGLCGDCESATW